MEFKEFPKIPRLNRDCIITEKIDGSNGSIYIGEDGAFLVGSRTRWITSESDNFGFAMWANKNKEELMKLGPGHHFGEWWGVGIQRGYDLSERRFSLFYTHGIQALPACCRVVPMLYSGPFGSNEINQALLELRINGSVAEPGYMNPEGIVVYHQAARQMFKVTLVGDDKPKGVMQ